MELLWSILHIVLAVILSPLMLSVIARTKAFFGGRKGPRRLLQPYYDIIKLLRKGGVYSRTTTWVFRAGPTVSLAAVMVALAMTPLGTVRALISFPGDIIALVYMLGLARFFTVIAALDTGSAFEGMGASRKVQFSILAELAFLLGMVALAITGKAYSLTLLYSGPEITAAHSLGTAVHALLAAAFLIVLLAENARIPVDDPNTHLELTMIHEVMVLDHGSVDLGIIHLGQSLKLWIFGALVIGAALPVNTPYAGVNLLISLGGMAVLAVIVGMIESGMARLRMIRVPQLLVTACILSFLALIAAVR